MGPPMPSTTALSLSRVASQRRRLSALLVAGNVLLGLLLGGLVYAVLLSSYKSHEAQVQTTAEQITAIAAASIESELALVDAALLMTRDELRRSGYGSTATDHDIQAILASRHRVLTIAEGFRLADENGRVRWGNLIGPTPPDITNRDFFHQAQSPDANSAVVSGPVLSRVSGHWVVVIARPLAWDGKFRGVLYATIDARHFSAVFQRYDLAEHDAIALRTRDMQLLSWHTPGSSQNRTVGSREVAQELNDSLAVRPSSGVVQPRISFDGIARTVAYREVKGWPFLVLVGLNNARIFGQWTYGMQTIGLVAGLAWVLSCLATLAVYRFGKRSQNAVAELDAQIRRTNTLLRVAGDGIHIVNRNGHMIEMSDSFAEMHGRTRQDLLGAHVSQWDVNQDTARINAWLDKIQDGDRQRVEVQHLHADGRVLDMDLHWRAVEIDGQLLVFGSARDITEKKRLVQGLEESAARIRDLYDHAPCGYFSLDADAKLVHINATARGWLGAQADVSGWRFAWVLDAPSEELFSRHFAALTTQGSAPEIEICLNPEGGSAPRYVRVHSTAVSDSEGAFLMSRTVAVDITAQHVAQAQVQALLRDQSAMLNSDIVGMVKLRDRKVSWKNAAFEKMLGYGPGELDGVAIEALCAEEGDDSILAADKLSLLSRGSNYRSDVQLRRKNGEPLWVDLNGVQLSEAESFWMAVDISDAKRAHEQITHLAFHDALTQLPNRLLLLDRLQQALAGAERTRHGVAVCFVDLDGFKAVNDGYGHETGDRLLVEIAARIKCSIRATDTAARFGGDEFVVLLAPLAGDEWRSILKRLMQAVGEPVELGTDCQVRVGLSIGVALSWGATDAQDLLSDADEAMLQAKRAGKNRVELAPSRQ